MAGLSGSRVGAVLRAEDYGRAMRFYRDVLGLDVDESPGGTGSGMVRMADGTGFMVYERPGMPAPQNTTLAFEVADVDATVAELRGRGVVFEEYDMPEMGLKTVNGVASMEDGSRVAWFKDTEGNIISLATM
jgi:predicted enzyme related to lactoylglutathione lyase